MNLKPRPRKLFSQLFPTYFFISLAGLVILLLISRYTYRNFYFQEIKKDLAQKAKLIQDDISINLLNKNYFAIQTQIKKAAVISESRGTVILPSGVVIADSDFDPAKMENHKDRKEIISAFKGEVGEALRFSPTFEEDFLYIAVPLVVDGSIIGVLRNSVSVRNLQISLSSLISKVLIWSFLLLIVLTYFIYAQAKKISTPLELMKNHVENFSLDGLTKTSLEDTYSTLEIDSLYRSISKMSTQIKDQFDKISTQRNEINAVFASMIEGVITILPDMTVYHINNSALKLFDYPKKRNIKGTALDLVINNDDILKIAHDLFKENVTISQEIPFNGRILHIQGSLLDFNDSLSGAVLVFDDITKMRELESHRTDFVANVSHELKTPLTVIQGYVETLKTENIQDKEIQAKFLSKIEKHTVRLKAIVEDLLSLSSLEKEASLGSIEFREVSIKKILSSVIDLCEPSAKAKKILIKCNCIDVNVSVAPALIEQALINLIENAIKYAPNSSEVNILTKVNESDVLISVIDQGQGIAAKHLPRLFERFYSVDKARSRELGGSGLGLSIVKHIALSHAGSVTVKSEVGVGSEFIFSIPRSI